MVKRASGICLVCVAVLAISAACEDEDEKACEGTPAPCVGDCDQVGCGAYWDCVGYGNCFWSSEWQCNNEPNCEWEMQCSGMPRPCNEFDDEDSCEDQAGCTWE